MLEVIKNISTLSVLLPLLCFLTLKALNKTLQLLLLLFIISVLTEVLCHYYAPRSLKTYNTIQNIYTLTESALLAGMFYIEFDSVKLRRFIRAFFIYLIIAPIAILLLGTYTQADNLLISIECVVMIILSFYFFTQVFGQLHIQRTTEYPLFWFSSAVLYYFSTAFVLYVFRGKLANFSQHGFFVLTLLNAITNVAHYLLFAIGIWKYRPI